MKIREFLKNFNLDNRGFAPLALIMVIAVMVVLGGVGYLIFRDVMGIGAGAILTGLPTVAAPQGGTTDAPSLQISIYDPVTNELSNGSVTLFKDSERVGVERIGVFSSSAGVISVTNLDPSTEYVVEAEPSSTTSWYPFQTTMKTYSTGPKRETLVVKHIHNTVPSVSVFNNDNRTANSTSARQAIAASDKKKFHIQLQIASTTNDNNYLGDGQLGLLHQFDLNGTEFQSVEGSDDGGIMDCTTYTKVSGHPANSDGNKFAHLACISALKTLQAGQDYDTELTFTSTATNPSSDSNGAISAIVYDSCRILNTNTGQYGEYWRNPVALGDICSAVEIGYQIFYS